MNLGSSKAFNVDGGVGDPPLEESELLQLAFLSLLLSFRYSRALKRSLFKRSTGRYASSTVAVLLAPWSKSTLIIRIWVSSSNLNNPILTSCTSPRAATKCKGVNPSPLSALTTDCNKKLNIWVCSSTLHFIKGCVLFDQKGAAYLLFTNKSHA